MFCYNFSMRNSTTVITTESEVRHISGKTLGLGWLEELASVYTTRALQMDWYRHEDLEVICCLHGRMTYEFGGHKKVIIKAGHGLVIPTGVRHRLAAGIDAPSRRVSFRLKRSNSEGTTIKTFSVRETNRLKSMLSTRSYHPFALSQTALLAATRLGHYLHQTRHDFSLVERCEMRTLACALLICCITKEEKKQSTPPVRLMNEATEWLEGNYQRHVDLDELIGHMGYGRTRFFTLFKEHTGLSPKDYLIRFRIAQAQKLLASGMSVKETATAVGFSDPAFFSRTFRQQTGKSPSKSVG